ncbi:MAG: cation transporter [Oscillospiraceae bacterium]|nr:cation transporter [Oscillospiraceae bacterium]MBQ9148229.1 cation transporter [Oscillospiraceae bacterium]
MTNLLLKLFVKNQTDPKNPVTRAAVGRLSGVVGILCNLLLFAGKLLVGTLAGSVSITADAMNNLSDATSSIVTLVGFRLAEKPADAEHPYGHARFEYLSGLAVAVMIIVIGFELAKGSVQKIITPSAVEFSLLTGCVLVGSILVKLWMALFNTRLGKFINSAALAATAADSRNDVISTGAVLAAGIVEHFTTWQIDGYVGLAVAVFILWSGWNMAKETISPLLGQSADPELRDTIADFITTEPKVLGFHDLMVHDYGPGQRFASLHVEMDKNEDALACHEIIDDLERRCLQEYGIHLVIHYDPVVADDPAVDRMRKLVTAILHVKDPRLSIHDFRMVPGSENTNLIFDVSLPAELLDQQKEIQTSLEAALNDLGEGRYFTVITFDNAVFN